MHKRVSLRRINLLNQPQFLFKVMVTIPKMHSFEKRTGVADPTFLLEVE